MNLRDLICATAESFAERILTTPNDRSFFVAVNLLWKNTVYQAIDHARFF